MKSALATENEARSRTAGYATLLRIAAAALFLLAVLPASGQDAPSAPSLPYPAKDDYQSYLKYVKDIKASFLDKPHNIGTWEPFADLIQAGRDEGVFQLAKVLRDTMPEAKYGLVDGDFRNPIGLAYLAGRLSLVRRLISLDRGLLELPDAGMESYGLVPLAEAVARDDLAWTKSFLDAGADIDTSYVEYQKGGGGYPKNLFTISKSKAMDDFLAGRKLKTVYLLESPADGSCNDDNVRMRSEPGTQGAVLAKLMKGDKFSVLASTYKRDTIGDYPGCWVKVSFKGQVGWVFEQFVGCDYFDMP
jgi:hypothetical protein